jgi:RIO kinase 1
MVEEEQEKEKQEGGEGDSSGGEQKAMDRADRRYKRREQESRFLKKSSEDYQVVEEVFDMPTMMVITKMVNEGIIRSVQSHFAAGKESKLYIAEAPDGTPLAAKIYLTVSAEFKKRMQYIAGDPRFSDIKKDTRSFIYAWARKEFKNLQAAHRAGVRVPAPIAVEKNVLIMEFIGDEQGNVATPLANLDEVTAADYEEVIRQMAILYQKANLVHADLSEYNIFKSPRGEIMLFDFGSAVDVRHPNSKQFLVRDVQNVNRFFIKRGVDVVMDTGRLVEKIMAKEEGGETTT